MSFRLQRLLIPAALLLTASLALAAPPAPEAPQAPAVIAAQAPAQPLAVLPTAAPVCKGADLPLFSPAPQTTATDVCGTCSDTACVGKTPNAVCGPAGFRCIAGSPTCTVAERFRCRCLTI
jgi:hypothetical protein